MYLYVSKIFLYTSWLRLILLMVKVLSAELVEATSTH